MFNLRLDLVSLAVCLGMAVPAAAQTSSAEPAPPQPADGHGRAAFLAGYDADRNGQVTRAEYDAIRNDRFKTGDADGDGFLSEEDYVAEYAGRLRAQYAKADRTPDEAFERQLKQAGVRFYAIDRDRDGKISAEENRAVAERTFEAQDTNGDNVVSSLDPQQEPQADVGGAAPSGGA